jgi:UDP-glucose 4-epimerase
MQYIISFRTNDTLEKEVQMNTVVTGGCGFIGSHIVEQLLHENHRVTVLDNMSTGRINNLKDFKNDKNLNIVKTNIEDKKALKTYFKSIDWVFHIAALADIVPSIQSPDKYYNSNVNGTFSVMEAVRENNVKKLVYAASSSCYGIPDIFPTNELAEIKPQYPYALTKNLSEQIVMHWGKIYKLPVISLRLFNVYGTRSRTSGTYGAVFGVFLKQKLANKPYTVVGDGSQTRDFTYVSDVANAFITAAKSDISNEILNVGSGGTYSINELVKRLKGDVINIPKRPGEPDCTFADITKIKKMLNWKPEVSFKEGIRKVLKNIDYWKEAPLWTPGNIKEATNDWFKYLK